MTTLGPCTRIFSVPSSLGASVPQFSRFTLSLSRELSNIDHHTSSPRMTRLLIEHTLGFGVEERWFDVEKLDSYLLIGSSGDRCRC